MKTWPIAGSMAVMRKPAALARRHFGPEVTEPIRLHVAAKRYLCAVDPAYLAGLSPSSRLSLSLQGGPMDAEERANFESNPFYRDAVRLRHWDDGQGPRAKGARFGSLS